MALGGGNLTSLTYVYTIPYGSPTNRFSSESFAEVGCFTCVEKALSKLFFYRFVIFILPVIIWALYFIEVPKRATTLEVCVRDLQLFGFRINKKVLWCLRKTGWHTIPYNYFIYFLVHDSAMFGWAKEFFFFLTFK